MKNDPVLERDDRHRREQQRLKALAARVRRLRDLRGMSRTLFSSQSKVSVPHIARLEAGQGNVSVLVLDRLAHALGVPLETMLADTDDGDQGSTERALLIEFIRKQPATALPALRRALLDGLGADADTRLQRIALLGIRGAGKSAVGELLSRRLKFPFIELDHEVVREAGQPLDRVFELFGQTGYRTLERRLLERSLIQQPTFVLAPGGGIVTDPHSCELLMRSCFTVWLHAAPHIYYQRTNAQRDERIASAPMRRQAMDSIRRTMGARTPMYATASLAIDSSELSVEQVVRRIMTALRQANP
jgi:XRE family transcriptional regulator, aerobic/anaerobic benzoate catabolism transcriptional regulator